MHLRHIFIPIAAVREEGGFMGLLESPVGDIAANIPGATAIFRKHKIDFCCGGGQTLTEACAKRGADAASMAAALESLAAARDPAATWTTRPLAELIDYILPNFHEKHRHDLPELIRLASRVEHVHADHPACPHGLAAALKETLAELEMHMHKEEQILFPMIKRGMGEMAEGPVSVMNAEHDEHAARLRRLEELAHDCVPPPGACNTWRACYGGVRALVDDVMEHIHLENNVLFPRALAGDK